VLARTAQCSGLCQPGYYCPMASISATQIPCEGGIFGAEAGLKTPQCSLNCEVNTGLSTGLDDASTAQFCVANKCSPGFVCPPASTVSNQTACGGADVYCPGGSVLPTPVSAGFYTVGPSSSGVAQVDDDVLSRTAQQICEPGFYCQGGVRSRCLPGSFGAASGLSNSQCSGLCAPGFICDWASSSAMQYHCGLNSSVYCPTGSSVAVSCKLII
jgi:hypothetical protein